MSMGSLRDLERKEVMWVCPKMNMGAYNPPERWGHSSCFFNGYLYIFGGCRGGVHFSDVLICDIEKMSWNILKTSGQGPGPRDSHSSVLVGHKMFVFGGTNGCKKVNDLHILDLLSREWTRPQCFGNPPSAREGHTANVFGDEKLVIFGGSGEGEANYLNDLHVLDLKNMEWSSPEIRGYVPAPRDSHSSVAVGNRLFVFGGDSGDRYQRDANVFDMNTFVWAKLDAHGPFPGARAGHASVSVGTKVYVLGGVGDKKYYNDIWAFDVITSSWVQLNVCSQRSQGRFSHTATVTNFGIAIFGGCGEDERPLNELLFLQINDSLSCKAFGNVGNEGAKMFLKKADDNLKQTILIDDSPNLVSKGSEEVEFVSKEFFSFSSDMLHPKRRRTCQPVLLPEKKPDSDDHSFSHSQHSSSSQSDHEQTTMKKSISYPSSRVHPLFRQQTSSLTDYHLSSIPVNLTDSKQTVSGPCHDPNQRKQDHANIICADSGHVQSKAAESLPLPDAGKLQNFIGAEVHGQVDGAFDSGFLMTATVNGKVFRGVLFAPGPNFVSRSIIPVQNPPSFGQLMAVNQSNAGKNHYFSNIASPRQCLRPIKSLGPGSVQTSGHAQLKRSSQEIRAPSLSLGKESRELNTELQGLFLTLAGPGSDNDLV